MTYRFNAEANPTPDRCLQVAARSPDNPFYTLGYVSARRKGGALPWLLETCDDEGPASECIAFLTTGWLSRSLEIDSLPPLRNADAFWNGLARFCSTHSVTDLLVNSFASRETAIPSLGQEIWRRQRREFVLDLAGLQGASRASTNHKRNVARARKAGVEMVIAADLEACRAHARLMDQSMERRKARGDVISRETRSDRFRRFTESGAGLLYQAILQGRVLSSVLVLIAERAGYYHSAGTSPEGMTIGASHFLIHSIAERLKEDGAVAFNLGGAHDDGLMRFKLGFGAVPIDLESARFCVGRFAIKRAASAISQFCAGPRRFVSGLFGSLESYVAYSCVPSTVAPVPDLPGALLEKLSDAALLKLASAHPEMKIHRRVLERLGHNDAFAMYLDGKAAHVLWLIPAEHDRLYPIRNVKLREREAEITHAVTLPAFRGRGLFPYAISLLMKLAAQRAIRRVWMITAAGNLSSRRAIEKAGLKRAGRIWRFVPRWGRSSALTLRGHRFILRGPPSTSD